MDETNPLIAYNSAAEARKKAQKEFSETQKIKTITGTRLEKIISSFGASPSNPNFFIEDCLITFIKKITLENKELAIKNELALIKDAKSEIKKQGKTASNNKKELGRIGGVKTLLGFGNKEQKALKDKIVDHEKNHKKFNENVESLNNLIDSPDDQEQEGKTKFKFKDSTNILKNLDKNDKNLNPKLQNLLNWLNDNKEIIKQNDSSSIEKIKEKLKQHQVEVFTEKYVELLGTWQEKNNNASKRNFKGLEEKLTQLNILGAVEDKYNERTSSLPQPKQIKEGPKTVESARESKLEMLLKERKAPNKNVQNSVSI